MIAQQESGNNILVLALSGKSGSGKSTCRRIVESYHKDYLSKKFPCAYTHVSIAEPIKKVAADLFGWDGDKSVWFKGEDNVDLSRGRGLLIGIGMAMRAVFPNVWIDSAIRRIRGVIWNRFKNADRLRAKAPFELFVIDDMRFPNEALRLREEFGAKVLFVRIVRGEWEEFKHYSESAMVDFSDWNYVVPNVKDELELRDHIIEILADHIHP